MTGIEKLRDLANDYISQSWSSAGKMRGRLMLDIADQIERECVCDADTIENVRLIVGGVIDDMERHCLGHEGMEDSPVARWARELLGALKSYASDEREVQNPSWHDPADAADVTSDAPKVTRDPAEDVSMSAYDLLPADEREAIAWVREHGGIEAVKEEWNHSRNLKRSLETAQAKVERQQSHIELVQGKCKTRVHRIVELHKTIADMRPRLMPEGMEWLVEAWPRFEDGEPVKLLDDFERYGEENGVSTVTMYVDGSFALNFRAYSKGERVNRPVAPSVPGADGEPLRGGETAWGTKGGSYHLTSVHDGEVFARHVGGSFGAEVESAGGSGLYRLRADKLTHERPDTWQRIEEDATLSPEVYCHRNGIDISQKDGTEIFLADTVEPMARDLVRRCRALAERERDE